MDPVKTVLQFHAATSHTPASVRASRHALDWGNQPAPAKRYPGLERVELPVEWRESDVPAATALSEGPAEGGSVTDLADLARLLFFSAGVTRPWRRGPGTIYFRAAPSAGALYPVEVYVVCADLDGLPAGVYHFEPVSFSLHRLRDGDRRGALAAASQPIAGRAPANLVFTGIPWRTTWKYQARGYRHLFWDAGAMIANLVAVADAAGFGSEVLAGFVDPAVSQLLGLGDHERPATGGEVPLAVVPLGPPGPPAPAAGTLPDIAPAVEPLSPAPVDEPDLWEVHHAGDLRDTGEVVRWQQEMEAVVTGEATTDVGAPDGVGRPPVEDVVLRRGSTRAFARDPVPSAALAWPLAVASRALPSDFTAEGRTLLGHHVAVHAVDGLDAGAYRWAPGGPQALPAQASRERSAFLCLGQPHGGDSAYTVFHGACVGDVVEAAGARAYRAVLLEAGVAAGRLQLAAFAAGIGATGLTFFDDEVREFFGADVDPMLAVACGVPAYDARPGRRPGRR